MAKKVLGALLAIVISTLTFSSASSASETNPYGGTAVTPPNNNEIIFTVTKGKISKNYSMNTLRAMKTSTITIYEPFVKKYQSFTVISIASLAKENGIGQQSVLKTIALNDYAYSNTLKNFVAAKGYIAIARSGKPIPYDQGGPIRIVFPKDSRWAKFLDPWNWSLSSIVVK
jgi:hypothetical protein